MNFDGRRIGVAGFAAVLPRVRGLRRLDKKPRGGDVATLFGYHRDAAPGTVIAQNVLIVVPKDEGWWLRAEVYGARQVYRAACANVQIWTSEYRRCRYCDKERLPFFSLTVFPSIVSIIRIILTALRLRDTKIHESTELFSREWPLGDDIHRAERTRVLCWFARTNEPKLFIESQGHCNWNNETRFDRIALSKIRFKSFSLGDVNTSGSLIYEMSVREERDFKVTSVFHTLVGNPEKPMRNVIKTGSFVTVAIHIDYV